MEFFDLFAAPKPAPAVIIRNIPGEQIELVNTRDLAGQNLRGRNWSHAKLSGLSLAGANCEGIVLTAARLHRTDFSHARLRGADLYLSSALAASFRCADLRGASLYKAETGWPLRSRYPCATFTDALLVECTDIPGRKVFGISRVIA